MHPPRAHPHPPGPDKTPHNLNRSVRREHEFSGQPPPTHPSASRPNPTQPTKRALTCTNGAQRGRSSAVVLVPGELGDGFFGAGIIDQVFAGCRGGDEG